MDAVEIVGNANCELVADARVGDQPGGDAAVAQKLEIAERQRGLAPERIRRGLGDDEHPERLSFTPKPGGSPRRASTSRLALVEKLPSLRKLTNASNIPVPRPDTPF